MEIAAALLGYLMSSVGAVLLGGWMVRRFVQWLDANC